MEQSKIIDTLETYQSGQESVMAVGRFLRNVVGPPEWDDEAMGSVVWVQC